MIIKLSTELTELNGTPIPGADGGLTLKDVFCNALVMQRQNEVIDGGEKVRRYNLALKIHNEQKISLSLDERKLVRDLVAAQYTPLIVGQVWNILDPDSDSEAVTGSVKENQETETAGA